MRHISTIQAILQCLDGYVAGPYAFVFVTLKFLAYNIQHVARQYFIMHQKVIGWRLFSFLGNRNSGDFARTTGDSLQGGYSCDRIAPQQNLTILRHQSKFKSSPEPIGSGELFPKLEVNLHPIDLVSKHEQNPPSRFSIKTDSPRKKTTHQTLQKQNGHGTITMPWRGLHLEWWKCVATTMYRTE